MTFVMFAQTGLNPMGAANVQELMLLLVHQPSFGQGANAKIVT
jgi:hypothetical protein